jgi:hypothetical protein
MYLDSVTVGWVQQAHGFQRIKQFKALWFSCE